MTSTAAGRRMPLVVRALGTGTGLSALAATVAFVTNVLMSRQLGPAPRGQVAFVLQTAYLLQPLLALGVDRTLLRNDSTTEPRLARQHLFLMTVLATVVLFAVFRDWRCLAAPAAYVMTWLAMGRSIAFRNHRFNGYAATVVSYQVFIMASSIVLFALHVDNWLLWLLPYAVPAIYLLGLDLYRNRNWSVRGAFPGVSVTSLGLMPGAFGMAVLLRSDRVILPIISTDAQLGLYVAIATATEALSWMSLSLADHRVARFGEGTRTTRGLLRMLALDGLLFMGLATAVAFAVWYILIPLLGPEFRAGADLVIPLCLAAVVLALLRQTSSWLLASHRPTLTTALAVFGGTISVPVYMVGISMGAALGAAWASLVAYSVTLIAGVLLTRIAVAPRSSIRDRADGESEVPDAQEKDGDG